MADVSAPLPPNFYDPKPVANEPATIYAVCATLLTIVLISLLFRLYCRLFVTKSLWWDDLFCVLSMLMVNVTALSFAVSVKWGMGQHIYLLTNPSDFENIGICIYISSAAYVTSTALIKISLTLQYLRIFERGTWMHRFTQFLIVFLGFWGFAWAFISWLPCFPDPSASWNGSEKGCYGTASPDVNIIFKLVEAHGGMNTILDLIVLAVPLRILFLEDAQSTRIGLGVLIFMGVITAAVSVWRFGEILVSSAGNSGTDITWTEPLSILLSIAEVCIATICASVPFFWPVITDAMNKIFVVHEFNVSSESRYLDDQIELAPSTKWGGDHSVRSLESRSIDNNPSNKSMSGPYADDFIQSQVNPFSEEFRTDTTVQSGTGGQRTKAGIV